MILFGCIGAVFAADVSLPSGDVLTVGLTTQLRASLVAESGTVTGELRLHRLRPVLGASLAGGRLDLGTQMNLTPGSAELIDAWGDALVGDGWRVRWGQFKTPFTLYRDRSFASMLLTDWAISSRAFGGERQLGAALRKDGRRMSVTAGLFAGRNQRNAHRVRLSELYGFTVGNPSALVGAAPPTMRLGPEAVVRLAWTDDGVVPRGDRDEVARGEHVGGWRTAFSGSTSLHPRPIRGEDFGARGALEAVLRGHGLGVWAVAYTSLAPVSDGRWVPALSGALVEVDVRLASWVHMAGRGAVTQVSRALQNDAVAPYSTEAEVAGGLSAYGPANLVLQVDVTRLHRAGATRLVRTTTRLQVQTAF